MPAETPPGVPPAGPGALDAIPAEVWRVSIVVVVGAFMTQLDTSLMNVGLATIATDLRASLQVTQWIVSGYLLALVIGIPLCGWASRRVGAGRVWLTALAVFTVASAACAAAGDIQALIAARCVQGLAAGVLLPAGQTVIAQIAGRSRMGRVMSTVGTALVLGPALGPVIGGVVISHASWPWLFVINVPVGMAGLLLGWRIIPRGAPADPARFDAVGFVLVGVGLPVFTYGISESGDFAGRSWAAVAGPLVGGLLLLGVFAWWSLRAARPLLAVRLFAGRVFTAAALSSFFAGMIQFGALVIWATYFQLVRGDGTVATGVSMVGFAVGAAFLLISGRLTDRFGGAPVCLAGAVISAAAFVPMALLPASTPLAVLEVLLVILGIANALSVVPASTAAYVKVAPSDLPEAVTQINILLRLGGAVGASLLVGFLGQRPGSGQAALPGFHAAFWCLLVISLLFTATALRLVLVSVLVRRTGPRPAARGENDDALMPFTAGDGERRDARRGHASQEETR